MGLSIGLHWLASNAIFLIIADGGYLTSKGDPYTELQDLFHVSAESFIALGYSPGFILICFLLSLGLIILLPIILSFQRLKIDMVAGGSNSLVISAACHIMNPEDSQQDMASTERVLQMSHRGTPDTNDEAKLATQKALNPAQKKLRWGAILITRAAGEFGSAKDESTVSHLGFGGQEYHISTPKEGEYYV
ncbi:hypothetical protein ANO14919_064860 [Xylariales sp. No.14919]|nr:hypothetical protein ANO14919_064860 [Xylariales sp. No.14919]